MDTTRQLLEKSRAQLQAALPNIGLTVERLIRIAMTSIQRNQRLMECTPISLLGGVMQAAQLGLELDGVTGMAYLVPYWNNKKGAFEAQFQPGYKGLMDLAYRSEHVLKFDAHAVYERDQFDYEYGLAPRLEHKPHRDADRGALVAAYAIAHLRGGVDPLFRVVEKHDIENARARSKSKDEGPWVTDYDAMAMKTALKRLTKLVRQSPELRRAIALDDQAEAQLPQGLELLAGDVIDVETVESTPAAPAIDERPQVQRASPEVAEADTGATIPESQQKRLVALMKGHRTQDELLAYLAQEYKINGLAKILKSDFEAIAAWATNR